MSAEIRLGTQGWNYPAWVGPFYPVGTRPRDMLATYARAFRTVEVDSTFYAIPPEPVVRGWIERVPEDFLFSLKVPQQVTHERRLVDTHEELERFLERVRPLGARLGVLLLQMAPDWRPTPATRDVLVEFLAGLSGEFRWAIEFRDPKWLTVETLDLLTERGVALTLSDGRWLRRTRVFDCARQPTADFAYVRWMGADRAITDYSEVQLDRGADLSAWGEALTALARRVRTVFGYVNNHYQGHSPETARDLQRQVGQQPVDPVSLRTQSELFETG